MAVLESTIAKEVIVKTGVPQRSVFGPILSFLFVNDISAKSTSLSTLAKCLTNLVPSSIFLLSRLSCFHCPDLSWPTNGIHSIHKQCLRVKKKQRSNGIGKSVCKILRQNLALNVRTIWSFLMILLSH